MTGLSIAGTSLVFDPHLSLWIVGLLALAGIVLTVPRLISQRAGALWRLAALAVMILAILDPWLLREDRTPLTDFALVIEDRSLSQSVSNRMDLTEETAAALREQLSGLPRLEVRHGELAGDHETRLQPRLDSIFQGLDRNRLAGVFIITDGQVVDPPDPESDAPVHLLITGNRDEHDRRIVLEAAPRYAIVGERARIMARIQDDGNGKGTTAPLILTVDGRIMAERRPRVGETVGFPVRIDRRGETVIEISTPTRKGEVSAINNHVAITVNGVRDRLRVLLVTGEPYPGARVWREMLRADPAVDLVHFTILRPPAKQDATPLSELSLIAFPTRELFEEKLESFNLIIFDRYYWRGVLPFTYLENVASYVRGGGALMVVAGPDFSASQSLFETPLASILPTKPSGPVLERGFVPRLSEWGRRHPITHALPGTEKEPPGWGRWYRHIQARIRGEGLPLLTGVDAQPLLVVGREGNGRVAALLSDQVWLWARGHDSGGPQSALLRRLAHWLMKEPDLEEERLTAERTAEGFRITRHSLSSPPATVTVTEPGGETQVLPLAPAGAGQATAAVPATTPGIYRIQSGDLEAVATFGALDTPELGALIATDRILGDVAKTSGGGTVWLGSRDLPEIRAVTGGQDFTGRNWLGIKRRHVSVATGISERPLVPSGVYLIAILISLVMAWYREGRGR